MKRNSKMIAIDVLRIDNITNVDCERDSYNCELDIELELENKLFFAKRWCMELSSDRQMLQVRLDGNIAKDFSTWLKIANTRLIKVEQYGCTFYLYRGAVGEMCLLDYLVKVDI